LSLEERTNGIAHYTVLNSAKLIYCLAEGGRELIFEGMRKLAQGMFPEIAVVPGSMKEAMEGEFAAKRYKF
jgi:hypothetical protein